MNQWMRFPTGQDDSERQQETSMTMEQAFRSHIFRHADAGYELARRCAEEQGVRIPMG